MKELEIIEKENHRQRKSFFYKRKYRRQIKKALRKIRKILETQWKSCGSSINKEEIFYA